MKQSTLFIDSGEQPADQLQPSGDAVEATSGHRVPKQIELPAFVGLDSHVAVEQLRALGLVPAIESEEVGDEALTGTVVAQEPEAASAAGRGDIVVLYIGQLHVEEAEPVEEAALASEIEEDDWFDAELPDSQCELLAVPLSDERLPLEERDGTEALGSPPPQRARVSRKRRRPYVRSGDFAASEAGPSVAAAQPEASSASPRRLGAHAADVLRSLPWRRVLVAVAMLTALLLVFSVARSSTASRRATPEFSSRVARPASPAPRKRQADRSHHPGRLGASGRRVVGPPGGRVLAHRRPTPRLRGSSPPRRFLPRSRPSSGSAGGCELCFERTTTP